MWTVPKEWQGETAYIIAGGPSVSGLDLSKLAGKRVIVVNSSYEVFPDAAFLFFGDFQWWQKHAPKLGVFTGRLVTCSKRAGTPNVLRLKRICPNHDARNGPLGPGLSDDPSAIVSQRTILQGAMNGAYHLGVNRMVLLGADMGRAEDGRSHHHTPHPWKNKPGNATWDIQMSQLRMIAEPLAARGVTVLNASPASRIDWWPKISFEEAF